MEVDWKSKQPRPKIARYVNRGIFSQINKPYDNPGNEMTMQEAHDRHFSLVKSSIQGLFDKSRNELTQRP